MIIQAQIQCDFCGCTQTDHGDRLDQQKIVWQDDGWIIEELCFCSEVCKKMEKGEMEHGFN